MNINQIEFESEINTFYVNHTVLESYHELYTDDNVLMEGLSDIARKIKGIIVNIWKAIISILKDIKNAVVGIIKRIKAWLESKLSVHDKSVDQSAQNEPGITINVYCPEFEPDNLCATIPQYCEYITSVMDMFNECCMKAPGENMDTNQAQQMADKLNERGKFVNVDFSLIEHDCPPIFTRERVIASWDKSFTLAVHNVTVTKTSLNALCKRLPELSSAIEKIEQRANAIVSHTTNQPKYSGWSEYKQKATVDNLRIISSAIKDIIISSVYDQYHKLLNFIKKACKGLGVKL